MNAVTPPANTFAQRRVLDLQLWDAEARVSAQLGRVESSFERELVARPREQRALDVAMRELQRCLHLRADFMAALPA